MDEIPLTEFDPDRNAIIQPPMLREDITLHERCVLPIYSSLIKEMLNDGRLKKAYDIKSGSGTPMNAVFYYEYRGETITVANPGIGAPYASAILEELIALGCRKFISCGSCGVLDSDLKRGTVIIPSSAIRDEGTSYHYMPPSREIEMETEVVKKLESVLTRHGTEFKTGKTWTTDAFYRETRGKTKIRKEEGCIAVDMECSAFLAVAQFRGVLFGQYLSASDDISGEEWDLRPGDDRKSAQEKIFQLSVEAVLTL
ncbi:nucleoside phosphorylase [Chloroflexota bacterium]